MDRRVDRQGTPLHGRPTWFPRRPLPVNIQEESHSGSLELTITVTPRRRSVSGFSVPRRTEELSSNRSGRSVTSATAAQSKFHRPSGPLMYVIHPGEESETATQSHYPITAAHCFTNFLSWG